MKTKGGLTKALLASCLALFLLVCVPRTSEAQSIPEESHNFITYDTSYNFGYAGIVYHLRVTRPANMFTPGHPDTASRPVLIHMAGVGEVGNNMSNLSRFGPHYWLANGWDGGITLANGKHYPIIISVQCNSPWPQTRELRNIIVHILNTYRIKRNSVHLCGLSMGGMSWTSVINSETSPGDETGMKLITSIVALQGVSNGVGGGGISPADFAVGTDWSAYGKWAKKYGGKFFGLEGTGDYREVWQVQRPMNDSMPGSAYFSYETYGGGGHCCWNTMYDPNNKDWQCVPPITNPNIGTNGFYPNSMGTYKKGAYVFQWMLRQGDTTLVGSPNASPVANAGTDQAITLPTNTVTINGTASDPDGSVSAIQWSRISGPTTFTIATPTNDTTAINNLVQGTYRFELRVTDNGGAIARDTVQVTVNPDPNQAPVVNAGADQTITLPATTVTLNGTATDPDGTIATVQWNKIAGPATFTIATPANDTTAVNNLVQGVYRFELVATDNGGLTRRDTVQVTVNPANVAPNVNAGADQTITLPISTVTLNGTATDPDGTIATVQWNKIVGPATFTIVTPANDTTVINSLVLGVYRFELVATDNGGLTRRDTVQVTVNPANLAPTASAGSNQTITLPVNTVTINGSAADADGTVSTIQWTRIAGPTTFTIVSPTNDTTVINNLVQGTYSFELTVTDNQGATAKDTVQVIVNGAANVSPTAGAGADQTITLPASTVTLSGIASDADGTVATVQWNKIAGPATFTIASPSNDTTAVNNLVQGTYSFELTVTDNLGAVSRDTVQVTVNASGNQSPTANAGADQTITLPTNSVTLNGIAADADGTIASVQWTKIAGPTTFTLVSATNDTTVVDNLVQGTYRFELTVTDDLGAVAKDTVQVTVNAAGNQSPTVNAGADQTITLPANSVTLNGVAADADGTIASVQWTKIAGPATFTIVSATNDTTVINNLVQGTYSFELTVTDDLGAVAKDTVQVTVNAAGNQSPTVNAGADQTITLPANSVTLNGVAADADGTIASVQWTKIAGPATFTIVSATNDTTVVDNLVQGTYRFELAVTDDLGAVARDTVQVIVNGVANAAPAANAGADQTITLPTDSVTLNGIATDADGTIASVQWTKIAGPATFTIVSPTNDTTVIDNLVQGTYRFELTVTDDLGAVARDTVQVTVNAAANVPPTANAGADQSMSLPINITTLNGIAADADGTVANVQWTKIAGPATFTIVSPANDTTVVSGLVQGVYSFELAVTDDLGAVARDTVQVTVNAAANIPPLVNAGLDQAIQLPVSTANLNGTANDPDGTIASLQWTKIAGPAAFTIASPSNAATAVNGLVQGVYQFELSATDNSGATVRDTVIVTVNAANLAPTVYAGDDKTITLPISTVTLTGSANDIDGNVVSAQWAKLTGPAANIVSPANDTTVINGLVQGVYTFELTVTDNQGATAKDTAQVTVLAAINQVPVVNAGADQTITLPANSVTLSGSATDADGTVASYLWTKISGPTTFTMSSPALASTPVNGMIQGIYQFELRVTDNSGGVGRDTVQITVAGAAPTGEIFTWNVNNGNIYIDNTTFGRPLRAGDVVNIGPRAGGLGYNWMALNGLNSGYPNTYITINFLQGAFFKQTTDQPYMNWATSLYGIKIVGARLLSRPEPLLRFRGNNVRYPAYIWFDSCDVTQTTLYTLDYTGGAPYNGDTTNMFHHWKITNTSFDGSYQMMGNSVAIGFGSPYNLTNNAYFRDIEIANCTFDNYPSPGGANPAPSNYIAGHNVFNISIHHNKFRNLGVVASPGGHTSAINLSISKMEIYSNIFGPNVFGDDIRMSGADLPQYPAYSGLGRVYNNITFNKRKYAFLESRYIDGNAPHVVPPIIAPYVRDRSGPEVWNTTCFRMATGQSVNGFYAGSASIYDFYRSDTVICHNSYIVEINDTTWNTNYVKSVAFALWGPYNLVDTSGNKVINLWSNAGIGDSTYFIPLPNGALHNKGVPVPSWLTTDFYGNPRTVGGAVDIGAVERQGGNASPVAIVGNDIIITLPINTVNANGSLSSDPDGSIASYSWTQLSGTAATIVNPSSAQTVINGLTTAGVRRFRLTVTDNSGATSYADWTVTVNPASANQPPVANAGSNQTITLPTNSVNLTGTGTDIDGTVVSYLWIKISGPAAGGPNSPTQAATSVTGLVQGVYQMQLTVTDNLGAIGRDTVTITVNAALPGNQAPTANAGPDQTITLPTNAVTLTGTGNDPDGTIASRQWTKLSGPAANIVSPTLGTTVVNGLVQGVYFFEFRVTDNLGVSGRDTVMVTVNPAIPNNQLPVANAGGNQSITLPTNVVTVTGSGTDPDGTIVAYQWSWISGPSTYTIASATSAQTTISNLVQGVYRFELRVTDNLGAYGRDTMTVTVNAAPPANIPPIANAGPNQTIALPTNSVTLTGSGTDADGTITSYLWTKVAGPTNGTILTPLSATTTVTGLVQGTYQFELRVTDNAAASDRDTVTITVLATTPTNFEPSANGGGDKVITLPTNSVVCTGSGTDPDGTIVAYQWSRVSGPTSYVIQSPNSAQTTISGLVQGVYRFQFRVTDNQGAFGRDTITITVNPAVNGNNLPPVSRTCNDTTLVLPTNSVMLTGTGSDVDGTVVAYRWNKIAGPSSFTIQSPTQSQSMMSDLVEGEYEFELVVTDNRSAVGRDTVRVKVQKDLRVESSFMIFPNPATTTINIKINAITNAANTIVKIYDERGTVVYQEQFMRTQQVMIKTIDVSRLAKGVYFVAMDVDINTRKSMKFVKQ